MRHQLVVRSRQRTEFIDITPQIEQTIRDDGLTSGLCHLFVPHTTAAITLNENADPDVIFDLSRKLDQLVPPNDPSYHHREGNSDAHVKSSLVGVSLTLGIVGGRLVLGTWQAIYFCEFDGPRERTVRIHLLHS